jgi:hypothetical protein
VEFDLFIKKIGDLFWTDNDFEIKLNKIDIKSKELGDNFIEFFNYIRKEWLKFFKNNMLNDSNINQAHRCNRALESYNAYLSKKIPIHPTLNSFILKIQEEENNISNKRLILLTDVVII